MNLQSISLKLEELAEEYRDLRIGFDKAENEINYKTAQFMLSAQALGAQPLRDAQVNSELHDLPEYAEFLELRGRLEANRHLTRIYMQLSKNMISASWGEIDYGK